MREALGDCNRTRSLQEKRREKILQPQRLLTRTCFTPETFSATAEGIREDSSGL